MSNDEIDLNEASFRKGYDLVRASAALAPSLKSMIDPATSDFINTPQVAAIRDNPVFASLYQKAFRELHDLGMPSIPVTAERTVNHLIEHHASDLRGALRSHPELMRAILAQTEACNITPTMKKAGMTRPQPVSEIQEEFTFPPREPTAKEKRLAEAMTIAPRVLFDREGNLKPGGVLTQPEFSSTYEKFKLATNDQVGTLRPVAEEVMAGKFLESVFADESHPLHNTLREAILRAAKKLPPEKPSRANSGVADAVRERIENAVHAQGASR